MAYRFVARWKAIVSLKLDTTGLRFRGWLTRHGSSAIFVTLLSAIAASGFGIPALQGQLGTFFKTEAQLSLLSSLLLSVGGALVGAAAIVSSLVLFAMQVNIERMPQGLFSRLSADRRLLLAFATTFLLSIGIGSLVVILHQERIALVITSALWGVVLVLLLFLYAYRRALTLVNPVQQLQLVVHSAGKDLDAWSRRAVHVEVINLKREGKKQTDKHSIGLKPDFARVQFFAANSAWTKVAQQGVRYGISYANRYAEQGDYEVSAAAFSTIIEINRAYVKAKGKTFFAQGALIDNPLATDDFINDTLEHLRQVARIAVARGDEQHIEQTLRTMASLVQVYFEIDYSSRHASRTHAHLAAAYLTGEVERIVAHGMVDVLMEGVRLMGKCAELLLAEEGPNSIKSVAGKIGIVSAAVAVKEEYRPVTLIGVEQLARLSFIILRTGGSDIRFAVRDIRESIKLVAKILLNLPHSPLNNIPSTYLAPYYSGISDDYFLSRLTKFVNAISDATEENQNAQQSIRNLVNWSDRLYETEKILLLLAISKRSHFTFEMIHWITSVTAMLLAVSNAPACDERNQAALRRHANWLINVISWVPDDEETIQFVANFQIAETLFESAIDARSRGCHDVEGDIGGLLVGWMFKSGQYQTQGSSAAQSMFGLIALALTEEDDGSVEQLKVRIREGIAGGKLPEGQMRDRLAGELRERAADLDHGYQRHSLIEQAIADVDQPALLELLEEIANLLTPIADR